MDEKCFFSAEEVLEWRAKQLGFGGRSEDIDWLIDIGGGLGWHEIQRLKVFQEGDYVLQVSLQSLSSIWKEHITNQVPLQYLLGKCPWSEFELEVDQSVFIPRQETEILLELALKKASLYKTGLWADIGTGSGALAVGLARSLPAWFGHAVDISESALSIAKKNLNLLASKSEVALHLGNFLEPLSPWRGSFDLIVSNPPYIPLAVLRKLQPIVRDHEPYLALNGGIDGMDACRKIVQGAKKTLKSQGWLIFEHHHDQSDQALKLLFESGFEKVDFYNDLNGIRRFAIGRYP